MRRSLNRQSCRPEKGWCDTSPDREVCSGCCEQRGETASWAVRSKSFRWSGVAARCRRSSCSGLKVGMDLLGTVGRSPVHPMPPKQQHTVLGLAGCEQRDILAGRNSQSIRSRSTVKCSPEVYIVVSCLESGIHQSSMALTPQTMTKQQPQQCHTPPQKGFPPRDCHPENNRVFCPSTAVLCPLLCPCARVVEFTSTNSQNGVSASVCHLLSWSGEC